MTDDVLRTDLVLENSRWLVRAIAPDGSVHIIHSREEWETLRARYSASEQQPQPSPESPQPSQPSQSPDEPEAHDDTQNEQPEP